MWVAHGLLGEVSRVDPQFKRVTEYSHGRFSVIEDRCSCGRGGLRMGRLRRLDARSHRSRELATDLVARGRSAAVGGGCRKRRGVGGQRRRLDRSAVQPGHVRGRSSTLDQRRQPPARPRLRRGGDLGRERVGRLDHANRCLHVHGCGPSKSDLAPQPLQSGRVRFGSRTPQARRFQGSIPRRTASSTRSRSETPRTAWL